jgi:Flp pilus assembly protein TadG
MNTPRLAPRFVAGPASERGSVLFETALAIPMLVAVCATLLGILGVGLTSIALGDTARDAARKAARGDSLTEITTAAQQASPNAQVSVQANGTLITIDLEQTLALPGLPGLSWTVHRSATAALESIHAR